MSTYRVEPLDYSSFAPFYADSPIRLKSAAQVPTFPRRNERKLLPCWLLT